MLGLEGTRFQDSISGILTVSLLPCGFLFFRPTKQNCLRERERGKKKKQANFYSDQYSRLSVFEW